jgi:hypothetical protein
VADRIEVVSPDSVADLVAWLQSSIRRLESRFEPSGQLGGRGNGPLVVSPDETIGPATLTMTDKIAPGVGMASVVQERTTTDWQVLTNQKVVVYNYSLTESLQGREPTDPHSVLVVPEARTGRYVPCSLGDCVSNEVAPTECECLDRIGVCEVSVEFRNVQQPPQLLDGPGGVPVDEWIPTDRGLCQDCNNFNRPWVVKPLELSPTVCKFAIAQNGMGFTHELGADDNACFPCELIGGDTGIVVTITCIASCQIGATADFYMAGKNNSPCHMAQWRWNPYDPTFFPSKPADVLILSDYTTFLFEDCYRPGGTCLDTFEGWPCTSGKKRFFDFVNCFWDATITGMPILRLWKCWETPPSNPLNCDVCPNMGFYLDSNEFEDLALPGLPPIELFTYLDSINSHVWRMCGSGGVASGVHADYVLPDTTQSCDYDVLVRYCHDPVVGIIEDPGEVRIKRVGKPDDVLVLVRAVLGLEGASELGGAVDVVVNDVKYRNVGTITVDGTDLVDRTLDVQIIGPGNSGDCLVFDGILFNRR